jgi:ferrous iron transport protein B
MRFILVGPPNSGKSTLYNWLTGSLAKVVNYPGSTVDYMTGDLAAHWGAGHQVQVMDSPGTYSLHPKSEDEEVTLKLLKRTDKETKADAVIMVLDPTQLSRHLVLALQVARLGYPMILVITMKDLLEKQNIQLETEILKNHFGAQVFLVDGKLGGGLEPLVQYLKFFKHPDHVINHDSLITSHLDQEIIQSQKLSALALPLRERLSTVWDHTLKLDSFFLHPVLGYVSFFVIMFLLFTSVYWVATPLMDLVETAFGAMSEKVIVSFPDSEFARFFSEGIVTSFAAVFVFVPQIFILFFFLSILEGSGYLSRAATMIDRPFSKIGLSGRSFVPFLSGYACAVPALMATRNISSSQEKWMARMIIPLLSCSARLPVYGLLLGFLFWKSPAWMPGLVLSCLYILSMVVATLAAGVLNRFIEKEKTSLFLMELPLYRFPLIRSLWLQAWNKTKTFILRAGPVIFVLSVFLWLGMNYPKVNPELSADTTQLEYSYLGRMGQHLEPVFEPMGLDWRGGVGLIAAFAAREVFVSTLAVLYHSDEEAGDPGLIEKLQQAKNSEGQMIFTTSVMWGLILFFMIALQCLSTVGVMIKESQSWKLAMIQLVLFNVLAYGVAVAVVQGLRSFGIS